MEWLAMIVFILFILAMLWIIISSKNEAERLKIKK